jgi:hypothetical protein
LVDSANQFSIPIQKFTFTTSNYATPQTATANVSSIQSVATGVITVTFTPAVLPAATNQVVYTPVTAATATNAAPTALDLSAAASAGQSFVYSCKLNNTVPAKYLPSTCK